MDILLNKKTQRLLDEFTELCKKESGEDVLSAAVFFLIKVHRVYGVSLEKNAEALKGMLISLDKMYYEDNGKDNNEKT